MLEERALCIGFPRGHSAVEQFLLLLCVAVREFIAECEGICATHGFSRVN